MDSSDKDVVITSQTRRMIVVALALIALACIGGEVLLMLYGTGQSDALMAVSSAAVGGIAGLAVPSADKD
jgi:hypothetical protein